MFSPTLCNQFLSSPERALGERNCELKKVFNGLLEVLVNVLFFEMNA